jgi:hypothetical protein
VEINEKLPENLLDFPFGIPLTSHLAFFPAYQAIGWARGVFFGVGAVRERPL